MFGMDPGAFLQGLSVGLIPGLFAITVHEVAHGWAAKHLGDPTAYMLGRLTLNPLKHIDPLGTVVVPLAMLWMSAGSIAFGWAKPVPVAFRNLRNQKRDMILVAAAGPGANFAMASGWALVALVLNSAFASSDALAVGWLRDVCWFGIRFNILLAVFNLLPIPPLDGGRVLAGLLPRSGARVVEQIEPFGLIIVVVLLVSQVLWVILEPPIIFFLRFFSRMAGFA